jgi:glutamate--cysteine ligase
MISTGDNRPQHLSCDRMLDYFLDGATPREDWQVGMELEKMGRSAASGRPIPYDGDGPTVRRVLELIRERNGGDAVQEAGNLIGRSAPWGTITIEPGGQV